MKNERITARMIAPCGLDCSICKRALAETDPCPGCLGPDEHKPEFCAKKCGIILCAKRRENGYEYCDECPDYPCGDVMEKENRYTSKYPLYESPKKNLQELLKGAWFADARTDEKYDATWTDSLIEALMTSEYGEGIARQWAEDGERNKRDQLKGYVVGLLKDAGILKGSYDSIARKIGLTQEARTLSRYMGQGKKQPYADWVKEYVAAL